LDESRFGLLPIQRRRITLTGVKPLGAVQYRFENFYVYGAVEPTTGESFFLELPYLNSTNFQMFLNEFSQSYPETLNIILMDNGSCHTAKSLVLPANVVSVLAPLQPRAQSHRALVARCESTAGLADRDHA